MKRRTQTVTLPGEKTNYKKSLKGRALAKLFFERDDYRVRWHKLVGRVKLQEEEKKQLQDLVQKLQSQIANDSLALLLAKQRAADLEKFVNLKRPDVERLTKAVAKQRARAAAGVHGDIKVTLHTKRRTPRMESV